MALIEIEKPEECCNNPLGPFDIVYITGKILVVNSLYYRSGNTYNGYFSIIRRLVKKYRTIMYANYVFDRNKLALYGVQPDHISVDLLHDGRAPLRDAKIILASGITRVRSLDEPMVHRVYMLRPSTKALLGLRNYIKEVIVIKGIDPHRAILVSVEKFGPLLNLNDIVLNGVRHFPINLASSPE